VSFEPFLPILNTIKPNGGSSMDIGGTKQRGLGTSTQYMGRGPFFQL
jgi:hypothetical protein